MAIRGIRIRKGLLRRLKKRDLRQVERLLRDKLGEYTTEDFEKFLGHYKEVDQQTIREIERKLKEL